MSNALTIQTDDKELVKTLQNSLYFGAKEESVKLVLAYCKASGLDPMQKPVHIVPMYDKASNSMRDVIMPGVGLYRTTAARTGEMAGVTEPEFGEDVTENLGGTQITYPKWCKVTVSRLLKNGQIVSFTSKELWKENYATAGKNNPTAPNAMWSKRPYAQLAKCAEAQALRKAFPEVGASPTADEMEGKTIDITESASHTVHEQPAQKAPVPYSFAEFQINEPKWMGLIESGKITANQIIAKIEANGRSLTSEQKMQIASWEAIDVGYTVDEETGEITV